MDTKEAGRLGGKSRSLRKREAGRKNAAKALRAWIAKAASVRSESNNGPKPKALVQDSA